MRGCGVCFCVGGEGSGKPPCSGSLNSRSKGFCFGVFADLFGGGGNDCSRDRFIVCGFDLIDQVRFLDDGGVREGSWDRGRFPAQLRSIFGRGTGRNESYDGGTSCCGGCSDGGSNLDNLTRQRRLRFRLLSRFRHRVGTLCTIRLWLACLLLGGSSFLF